MELIFSIILLGFRITLSHWRITLDWSVRRWKYLERITFTTFSLLFSIYFSDNWDSRSYPFRMVNANRG